MKRLTILLALAVSGCAALAEPDEATVLRAAPTFERTAGIMAGPAIAVSPVQAQGAAGDRRYAYVDRAQPGVVRQAATLFWEDPPPRMLQQALIDGLNARGGKAVGPAVPVETGRRVSASLQRFEEVTGGGGAEAAVAFDATVAEDRALVLQGRYCGTAAIASDSPEARAQAFTAALGQAVTAFADDLRTGQSSRGC